MAVNVSIFFVSFIRCLIAHKIQYKILQQQPVQNAQQLTKQVTYLLYSVSTKHKARCKQIALWLQNSQTLHIRDQRQRYVFQHQIGQQWKFNLLDYNILSKCAQKMKKSNKSLASKKGSCLSFYTGLCRDESSLQLMRISLKKENDRRQRLQKLLQKYEHIRASEKIHIKTIKASIIELKDVQAVPKIHFLVDPNIYVDNNLSIETRQFLCMLLNTFYKRYEENKKYELQTAKINENIISLIKNISSNEDLLFKIQKTNINTQVQLQGELLNQKNKLKEEIQKGRELQSQEKRVKTIWIEKKQIYQEQKSKVDALVKIMKEIEGKIVGLNQKISKGEEIRQGNQNKISGQMVYQMKFDEEINKIRNGITAQISRETDLKKRIRQKQIKLDKLKGILNYDKSRHQVELKILDLQQPRPSTKLYGMGELLEMQRQFQKVRMSRTQATQFYPNE